MKTIIKAIECNNGTLYYIKNGNRYQLAESNIKIQIEEHKSKIPILGAPASACIKRRYITIALCEDMELSESVEPDFLSGIERFEIAADIKRSDGKYEKVFFNNIVGTDLDLDFIEPWEFEIKVSDKALLRKLLYEF